MYSDDTRLKHLCLLIVAWSCRTIMHSLYGGGKGTGMTLISCESAGQGPRRLNELCFWSDKVSRFFFEFLADD